MRKKLSEYYPKNGLYTSEIISRVATAIYDGATELEVTKEVFINLIVHHSGRFSMSDSGGWYFMGVRVLREGDV